MNAKFAMADSFHTVSSLGTFAPGALTGNDRSAAHLSWTRRYTDNEPTTLSINYIAPQQVVRGARNLPRATWHVINAWNWNDPADYLRTKVSLITTRQAAGARLDQPTELVS